MPKFQSFAQQGSFRDYQLEAPDQTAKIEQQTARTIRGRERAQAFLEENNRLYLQAQKLAQSQEENNREQNFKLESVNRRAYKDLLDQEYNLQVEANRQQLAAKQQDYKNLSAFSKSAFEIYTAIDKSITERQTDANTVNTILAGTTYQENLAIQSMVGNFTEAEFAQQELIQNLVKEGKDVKALWTLFNNRNTRGFIDNAGVIQNTANAATPFIQEVMLNQDPELSVSEKRLDLETRFREWLATSFKTADGRQLNPKLVANLATPIFSRAYTQAMGELDREESKENEKKLALARDANYNTVFSTQGPSGILALAKGREQRGYVTDWIVSRVEAGTMTAEEAQAFFSTPYKGPNGDTTWSEQDPSDPSLGRVNEAVRKLRKTAVDEYNLSNTELSISKELEIQQKVDEFVANGDGSLSPEELAVLEDLEKEGPVGFTSKALEEARGFTLEARAAVELSKQWEQKLNAGTLTTADVLSVKGNFALTQEWLPKAQMLEKLRESPESKTDIDAIKAKVAQDPRIKAAPVTGKENYSVILMQDRFVRMYKATLARTGDPEQARAATIAAIDNLQKNPAAVTNGFYTDIVNQEKTGAASAKKTLKEYQDFLKAVASPNFRSNPKEAVNAVGAYNFKTGYDAIAKGKEPPALIKKGAEILGISPLEFINFLAKGAGVGWDPITVDSQLEEIQRSLKPITRRLYNVTRTNERIIRAGLIDSNGIPSAPRRDSFGPSQSSSLSDPVLRRAADITSNYESAGAGGYNAVNQGGTAGGTAIPAGFYSGDFRSMKQHKGRALTDLTIGEIMDLQADPGSSQMSDAEWVQRGKLHAVGRYQFIGPTLKGLVQRLGISRSAKFTPELQDRLFLSLLKSGGPGQWVGLRNATAQEMALIRQAQSKL